MAGRKTTKKKAAGAAATKAAAKKPRKKTGKTKRATRRKVGLETATELAIRATTAEGAETALYELGRSHLGIAEGLETLDVSNAYDPIAGVVRANPVAFAERQLTRPLLDGATRIAARLAPYVVPAAPVVAPPPAHPGRGSRPPADPSPSAADAASTAAELLPPIAKAVRLRRGSVNRVASGPVNKKLRHAFGLGRRFNENDPASLLKAVKSLLAGVRKHPGTRAAALFTQGDLDMLRGYSASLAHLDQSETQAERAESADNAEEHILRAALVGFYRIFGGVANIVFEHDEKKRVDTLKLIPRRAETRATTEEEDESSKDGADQPPAGDGAAPAGGTPPTGGTPPAGA